MPHAINDKKERQKELECFVNLWFQCPNSGLPTFGIILRERASF